MMGALPQSLTTMPPVFAGLMPTAPATTGDEGGFEQLVAVQAKAATPAVPVAAKVAVAEAVQVAKPVVELSAAPAAVARPADAGTTNVARAHLQLASMHMQRVRELTGSSGLNPVGIVD